MTSRAEIMGVVDITASATTASRKERAPWRIHAAMFGCVAAAVAALVLGIRELITIFGQAGFVDSGVYRAFALRSAHGQPIYGAREGGLPFTYPPFALLGFRWMAWVSHDTADRVLFVAGVVAMALVAAIMVVRTCPVPRSGRIWRWTAPLVAAGFAVLLAAHLEPVTSTLKFGQINTLLMLVVVVDLLLLPPKWRGVGIGIAAAVKLTPLIFLLYFLATRQRRAALRTAISFASCALLALMAAPRDSIEYWFGAAWHNNAGSPQYAGNQSLLAALTRLFGNGELTTVLYVLAAAACVAVLVTVLRRVPLTPATQMALTAVCGLLVSPVSWSHHWVWCVPLIIAVALEPAFAPYRRIVAAAGIAVLFTASTLWLLPAADNRELSWTFSEFLTGDAYVLLGLVVLAYPLLTALDQRRAQRHDGS